MEQTELTKARLALEPCPFCGGGAKIYTFGAFVFSVHCRKCGTEYGKDYKTKDGAVRAWNRRIC